MPTGELLDSMGFSPVGVLSPDGPNVMKRLFVVMLDVFTPYRVSDNTLFSQAPAECFRYFLLAFAQPA